MKELLKEKREEIINEFMQGQSLEELAKTYNSRRSEIYNLVSISFKNSIDSLSDDEKENIIKLYNNNVSTTKIAEKYLIYHKEISKFLKENNVIVNQGKTVRTYSLNENYFDEIDSQNKAYILGLFYADGYNSIKKGTVAISLQEEDFEILEKIRKEINSEKELEFMKCSDRKDKDNDYHYKDMYKLLLFSSHMCKTLEKIGMVQNKSLVLEFPKALDKSLYRHFIRGYFDGDGSLHAGFNKYGKFQSLITITSTHKFCKKIQEILKHELNIPCGGIYDASSHNGITKVLSISGVNQDIKILEWLYKDAELYMKRKYENYIDNLLSYKLNNSRAA